MTWKILSISYLLQKGEQKAVLTRIFDDRGFAAMRDIVPKCETLACGFVSLGILSGSRHQRMKGMKADVRAR